MPRRRRRLVTQSNHERWLLTYADLITLLLAFFIVMYSMSRLDATKFHRMADAFNGALRGGPAVLQTAVDPASAGLLQQAELSRLADQIRTKASSENLEDRIEALQDERGLVIRVLESAAFDEGSADLKPRMYPILNVLAAQLRATHHHLRVEGHTDNRPISTARFPSNWELSTSRATGVVRYFVEELKLDPVRVSALGYGEFRPITSNDDAEGRARNRRVDLIVLADASAEPANQPPAVPSKLASTDSLQGVAGTLKAPH